MATTTHSSSSKKSEESGCEDSRTVTYSITGSAAHSRLAKLFPAQWEDCTHQPTVRPQVLWENAPRHATKPNRDSTLCYSHLPNGTSILDSKWVLARIFAHASESNSLLATLPTFCLEGRNGFLAFCETQAQSLHRKFSFEDPSFQIPDLDPSFPSTPVSDDPAWWVIKDASSNGAGGIWMYNNDNGENRDSVASKLDISHSYVAQRYTWPMVLYQARKCHVRVYGLLLSDGRAFLHEAAFLHVANEKFTCSQGDDSIHITNCCANSHDPDKFAGEICATLTESKGGEAAVSLSVFSPSMQASMRWLAMQTAPFVQGGTRNGGFEYLGLDFILSYNQQQQPVAYLLEVNAPPSQDTATGLPHAEALHDQVLRDLVHLWILPQCDSDAIEEAGGWQCVYQPPPPRCTSVSFRKATLMNKMKWALVERKRQRKEGVVVEDSMEAAETAKAVRSLFDYYAGSSRSDCFLENAGGTQVPRVVVQNVMNSLSCRDRMIHGKTSQHRAKQTVATLLGISLNEYNVYLGLNATQLLAQLAGAVFGQVLQPGDEMVLRTDNHCANVQPWLQLAERTEGVVIKWWTATKSTSTSLTRSHRLQDLVTSRTKVVAVSQASNVLGQVLVDMAEASRIAKRQSRGYAQLVVDGVAAVPHVGAVASHADWYVVSCHKWFGPHLGVLCGRKQILSGLNGSLSLELGTMNYEACQGLVGLGLYFIQLAQIDRSTYSRGPSPGQISGQENNANIDGGAVEQRLSRQHVEVAYNFIRRIESPLTAAMVDKLSATPKVRLIQSEEEPLQRLPVVCFVHCSISGEVIVETCRSAAVHCRLGNFLACEELLKEFCVTKGMVRLSLAHYNTLEEVQRTFKVLESIPGWH